MRRFCVRYCRNAKETENCLGGYRQGYYNFDCNLESLSANEQSAEESDFLLSYAALFYFVWIYFKTGKGYKGSDCAYEKRFRATNSASYFDHNSDFYFARRAIGLYGNT